MLSKNIFDNLHLSFWNNKPSENVTQIQTRLQNLGILLESKTGHIFYSNEFKPLTLNFDLVFVRHGETYGNCGQSTADGDIDIESVNLSIKNRDKRIYQGNVDTEINQLTKDGIKQATAAADKLKEDFLGNGWAPDIIFISPLKRAKDTALPFISINDLESRCIIHEGIKEMSFGLWDNRRVCDLPSNNSCHLFYLNQHALVKDSGINGNGLYNDGENFCEVVLRAYEVLMEINNKHNGKKILMFSHSMFGAACSILLGKGQQIENDTYLAFDGKRTDGTYYTMPNATPILLNIETPNLHKKLVSY